MPTKPVKPIPPSPHGETMLSILIGIGDEVKDLDLTISRKPIDPKQYPDWLVTKTESGKFVAVRLLG